MDSLAPIGPIQVANERDVSGPEVPKLCHFMGGGSAGVGLIEGPVESLDGSNSDDSPDDLGDQNEGVSDLGLGEDIGSLLSYLRAW